MKQLEGEEFAESQPWRLSASGAKVCRSQRALGWAGGGCSSSQGHQGPRR